MKKSLSASIFIALLALSCESPNDSVAVAVPARAIVTGIVRTNDIGVILGTWGIPSSDEDGSPAGSPKQGSFSFGMFRIRPNPVREEMRLHILHPDIGPVRVWVVRAELRGIEGTDNNSISGAVIPEAGMRTVRTIKDGIYAPGEYEMEWDTRDDQGNPVPAGFYRVYAINGRGQLRWQDLYVSRSSADLPHGLRSKIPY